MYQICVDIGGTSIKAAIVSRKKIVEKVVVPTEANKTKNIVVKNIISAVEQLYNNKKYKAKVKRIVIAVPGPADYEKGIIRDTPHLPLKNTNLKLMLKKRFKKKIIMDNDSNCFALAEQQIRYPKAEVVVGLTLGTGVGSGIIIDGKILHGKGFASELGHMTINFDGMKSACGNNGCLDTYLSGASVMRDYHKSAEDYCKHALKKDNISVNFWKVYGKMLGIGLANISNIFDPDVIVVGGKLANAWKFFEKEMKNEFSRRALNNTKIVQSRVKDAGMIGASLIE